MAAKFEFDKTITYLLARLTTAYRNALEEHMNRVDLHGGQAFVLIELWREDGLRQVEIARRLGLRPPTITKMVNALVQINLVERVAVEGDARSTRVFLTDNGRAMERDVADQWVELESDYLSALTGTERGILPELLAKLRDAYLGRETDDEEE